ncbi:predicted protein [Nematostella vectensis]|uniref:Uncharacterized protein n=1 Tax=Nematostella vectensis TaxID=45351 RepID=A7SD28_NEMVE|nr:succinate dehydrogenase cytochrome b560 subunit, mitochondrial [Nematostella vectensis]EDO38369.1 predicted protein [Nematostella vectensis]|eukprot:XP_001630432.1 predicted protein [Nematostella vectensis]
MALMLRSSARFLRPTVLRQSCILARSLPMATAADSKKEDFFKKNERLKRPMSPFLLTYKFEFPALLSGSHRVTGVIMTTGTTIFALCALGLPEGLEHYVNVIKGWELPRPFIFTCKTLLAWPVCYHGLNGLRHLFWDIGKGFEIKTLYKTGTVVGSLATLLAIAAAYYL